MERWPQRATFSKTEWKLFCFWCCNDFIKFLLKNKKNLRRIQICTLVEGMQPGKWGCICATSKQDFKSRIYLRWVCNFHDRRITSLRCSACVCVCETCITQILGTCLPYEDISQSQYANNPFWGWKLGLMLWYNVCNFPRSDVNMTLCVCVCVCLCPLWYFVKFIVCWRLKLGVRLKIYMRASLRNCMRVCA